MNICKWTALLVLLAVWAAPSRVCAKTKSNVLLFVVSEEVTYSPLSDLEISVTRGDGETVPVDSVVTEGRNTYRVFFTSPSNGDYTLLVEKDGYYPCAKPFKKTGRIGFIGLGSLVMKKTRARTLDEVTVTATHVKMVMRGDTVVYDARAFELAEGSMLDALVAQLPGTELKDGRIMVNGKFVESLLVNGEDFFSGNPSVALQNLPAYTVGNIKVYDREAPDAYLRGGRREGDPEHIVMDVSLKKQYSYGAMASLEGGYGTGGKYKGKAFGMGYADNLRVAAYANLNNVKDTRSGTTGGGWEGGWEQDGRMDLKMGGVDYLWARHGFKLQGSATLTGERPDVLTQRSTVSYYEDGDIYGRALSRSRERKLHLLSSHQWSWKGGRAYAELKPSVDYMKNDYSRLSRSASFDRPVAERYRGEALDSLFGGSPQYLRGMLSRVGSASAGSAGWLRADVAGSATLSVPGYNDNVRLTAGCSYRRDTDNPNNSYTRLFGFGSGGGGSGSRTLQEKDFESVSKKAFAGVCYTWWYTPYYAGRVSGLVVTPKLDLAYADDSRDNILRQTVEDFSDPLQPPSSVQGGRLPLDAANSYNSRLASVSYKPGLDLQYDFRPSARSPHALALYAEISAIVRSERLDYAKGDYTDRLSRTTTLLNPRLRAKYTRRTDAGNTELEAAYEYGQTAPSLTYRLKTSDTSSPTSVYLNNPGLRNSSSSSATLRLSRFWSRTHRSLNAGASYSRSDRAVAQARYYDRNTGVSTWRPENIDGNWSLGLNAGYTVPFGIGEAFQFSGSTTGGYVNSVDYATETETLTRSVVRTLSAGQQAGLSLRLGKNSAGVSGGVAWQRAKSRIGLFEPVSAFLYSARANCLLDFGRGWQISTDLNLYARRGYSDGTLNTTDWIWNASLSRTFLKGSLTATAEAVDILGQVSQVRNVINAQGRAETWVNSLPRYAMLRLIYRLNIMPRKK